MRALVVALVAGASSSTFAQEADQAVRDQWFTGSLEAPSPALSKAGAFEIEPYGLFNLTTGTGPTGLDVLTLSTVVVPRGRNDRLGERK